MKFRDISIILLAFIVAMIASMKVFLVFDYKRDFVYLSEIQKSIDLLKNENSKLRIEYILLSNSLSIDQPAKEGISNEKD
jgi:cell division protein FtsL|tara:strand:+ start:860 stop:1099 length:240 start_codon:yes stop_codon:yes gene_type:complete